MNSAPLLVASAEPIDPAWTERFGAELPGWRWLAPAEQARAEVIFGRPLGRVIRDAANLCWIHIPFAGVSPSLCAAARERGVVVTNSRGIYNQTIAEHTLMLMLALARRLDLLGDQQRSRVWATPVDPLSCDLAGATVGIVGLGGIGQAIARLCRAFGMQVMGMRRTARPTPFVDRLYPAGELHAMAPHCQWLVIAAPRTEETECLVDAAALNALPAGARLINVSRGALVDEPALIAALQSGRLAGAGLDVSAVEPMPSESPLWSMPSVLITPHVAAISVNASRAAFDLFLRAAHRYEAGLALENQVDLDRRY